MFSHDFLGDMPWFSHLPSLQGPHQRSLRGLGVRADARAPLRSGTLGGTVDPPVNQQFATEHMAHLEFMDTYGYVRMFCQLSVGAASSLKLYGQASRCRVS